MYPHAVLLPCCCRAAAVLRSIVQEGEALYLLQLTKTTVVAILTCEASSRKASPLLSVLAAASAC